MSRVIRNPQLGAPQLFGDSQPRFVDQDLAALIEEARAEAFEHGRREGFAAGREAVQDAVARLERALQAASTEAARIADSAVGDTLDAALAVAEFVVGALPEATRDHLALRLTDALEALDDPEVTVRVNPSDWDSVAAGMHVPVGVSIERDPTIRPGEAILEGRWSRVELTTEAALRLAREALT